MANEQDPIESNDDKDKDKDKKPKFSSEQIAFLDDIFKRGYGDGAAKARKEMEDAIAAAKKDAEDKLAAEKAERERLAKELEALKGKTPDPPKPDPAVDALKAQVEEFKGIVSGLRSERDAALKKQQELDEARRRAAKKDAFLAGTTEAKVSFFDPFVAYRLAEDEGLEWDAEADRPVIKNKHTGHAKLNGSGEPMSVADFVKEFATKNNYLVKAPVQDGGTGGGPDRRVDQPQLLAEKPIDKMTNEEFEAYRNNVIRSGRGR